MLRSLALFVPLLALAAAPPDATSTRAGAVEAEPYYSRISRSFAHRFPREHLTHARIDDAVSSQAWTNYLAALDYERLYFLASDVADFRKKELSLDDDIKKGDLVFPYHVFQVFKKRFAEREQYVSKILEKELDLTTHDRYEWDRKNAPWPNDSTELDGLWHRRIRNEYIQYAVAQMLTEVTSVPPTTRDSPDESSPAALIRKKYKQTLTVLEDNDAEWVLQRYLTAFAHAFDPHSGYMSPSSMDDFNIEMQLSLVGIGALLSAEDGTAKVLRLIPGGPADRDTRPQRLKPEDRIVAVAQGDGPAESILHWPLYKTVQKIRGEKGSRVVLTVIPAEDQTGSTTKIVDLVRDEVKLDEQAATFRITRFPRVNGPELTLGIITLPTFYANLNVRSREDPSYKSCADDVRAALSEMKNDKADGILLDLRNNGGGALLEAVKMTGLFIRRGPVVQVRERYETKPLPDPDPEVVWAGPLVVLVDRVSASASEILAAALQDYGRAIVVGDTRTHGKGTVQTILNLGTDERLGSLRVTTAGYYRITGQSTQVEGVSSDIVVPSRFAGMKIGEDYLQNPIKLPRTKRVPFTLVDDLGAVIPVLRERSLSRRASDSAYAAYMRLLERIETSMRMSELSLNLQDRIERARIEKELADVEIAADDASAEKNARNDPVQEEALRILADLISLQSGGMIPPGNGADAGTAADEQSFWSRRSLAILAVILLALLVLPVKRRKHDEDTFLEDARRGQ